MTIYLFGDSYVEAEKASSLGVRDHKRWYDILSEKMNENHENYGKCGEGPINTMDKFQTRFESGWFDSDDKFVIVLSSPYRIPWKWNFREKDEAPSTIFQDFFQDRPDRRDLQFSEEQLYALKSFYDCMHDEMTYTNVKNMCLLKHISHVNYWPIIVFNVFGTRMAPMERQNGKNFNLSAYDLEYLNDDLFYTYPTPLYEHSIREWQRDADMNEGMLNHFSERNHEILANIICNHFTGSNHPVQFHERFIVRDVNKDHRNDPDPTKFVDFIYE